MHINMFLAATVPPMTKSNGLIHERELCRRDRKASFGQLWPSRSCVWMKKRNRVRPLRHPRSEVWLMQSHLAASNFTTRLFLTPATTRRHFDTHRRRSLSEIHSVREPPQ
jgi:hypothetical protein